MVICVHSWLTDKLKSRILVIFLFGLACLAPWYNCTGRNTHAEPNLTKIDEPNSPAPADLIKVTDANAPLDTSNNQTEEANDPSRLNQKPQPETPNYTPPATPSEHEDEKPSDVNDNDPNTAVESAGDIFNTEFETVLSQYVNDNGMVDYDTLHRYNLKMKSLLAQLATLDPQEYQSWTREEKIAFWINTYNIKMLDIIADNYPIESKRLHRLWWPPSSIRHIPPRGEVGTPKWNSYKFIVMDEEFTLYEIENRFFREEFADPRVFFALSLACLDSPPLQNKPYYGKDLDRQLDEQVKRFLATPNGIKIDRQKEKVSLSVLFEPKRPWFGTEFLIGYGTDKKFKSQSPDLAAVLNFITNYLDQHDVKYLETGNYSITFKAFDWRVNEQ